MWLLWRRVGTEGYYANLDNQFAAISKNVATLEAGKKRRQQVWGHVHARFFAGFLSIYLVILAYATWVMQQPSGKFSSVGHAKRVAPVFIAPFLAYVVYTVGEQLRGILDRRANAQIQKLKEKLRKMIADLKDSTRYQRTQALLVKYDPDQQPPVVARGSPQNQQKNALGGPQSGKKTGANRAANAAATAVTGAGMALSSALGQMFSTVADKLIADEPTVVAMLQDAQRRAMELEQENAELRRQLGLSPRQLGGSAAPPPGDEVAGFGSPVTLNPNPPESSEQESPRALGAPSRSPSSAAAEEDAEKVSQQSSGAEDTPSRRTTRRSNKRQST